MDTPEGKVAGLRAFATTSISCALADEGIGTYSKKNSRNSSKPPSSDRLKKRSRVIAREVIVNQELKWVTMEMV
jgi:Family of unknown function (DUF6444)